MVAGKGRNSTIAARKPRLGRQFNTRQKYFGLNAVALENLP